MDLKRHAVLSLLAVVLGIAVVWWLEPTTGGGVMLVMVLCLLLFNAIGALTGPKQTAIKRRSDPEP